MPAKPTVVLIDEERTPLQYYVRALRVKGFQVRRFYGTDETFEKIQGYLNVAAIILDIMLPPGERYENVDTHEGLLTGVLVYRDLRILYPEVPIVILTNVALENVSQYFSGDPHLDVVMKMEYPPFKLAGLVSDLVRKEN